MRKMFMAILALAGAATLLLPAREAASQDEMQVFNLDQKHISRAARPARLRSSSHTDPDTVWIGHVYQSFWDWSAGGHAGAWTGGAGPHKVGRGPNLPIQASGTIGDNGTWDFDRFQAGETDSLQGWWPLARPYTSGNSNTKQDYKRSFFSFDYGNQVNYVINQGGPSVAGPDGYLNKRTFGVVGLWHRDGSGASGSGTVLPAIPNTSVVPLAWDGAYVGGTGSTASAWMGVKSHGDLNQVDEVSLGGTGNAFSSALFMNQVQYPRLSETGSASANGTDHNFPGYGSQLDQLLYRDIVLGSDTAPLTISWNYSTNMSTGKLNVTGTRAGWFDKDPLSLSYIVGTGAATVDGNFISSTAAAGPPDLAPCDSFMVYIGAPVNDAAVQLSNAVKPVYDQKRRWFSEVLKLDHACAAGNACAIIGKELASYAGEHLPSSESVVVSDGVGALGIYETELNAILDADGVDGNGGTVRLVFRVKTNRNSDDEIGYSSGTKGAAIVDNVLWTGGSAADGDFESATSINNRTDVAATAAWKSTGKPPSVFFHVDQLATLDFDDQCGGQDDPKRRCNMYGKVVVGGNHDAAGHKSGGNFGANDQDVQRFFASPTINLCSGGPGDYNAQGIDANHAFPTSEYILFGSDWNGDYVNATSESGEFRSVAFQFYPSNQANGNKCWSEINLTPTIFFNGAPPSCTEGAIAPGARINKLIKTSNANGRPDSVRVVFHRVKRCYSSGNLTDLFCAPTGFLRGAYVDNLSLGLVNGAPPPEVSNAIWYLYNDAFPNANRYGERIGGELAKSEWDTAGAQIRNGANNVAAIGIPGNLTRANISGDSMVIQATGADVRLDMVFRILPGPGNYGTTGDRASQLKKVPQDATLSDPVAPTDGDFWGHYMASAGDFASSASHPGAGAAKRWDKNLWNSARMDTAEVNLYPSQGTTDAKLNLLAPGTWMSTYHESDGKFSALGILKNICHLVLPAGSANSTNITCENAWGWGGAFPPTGPGGTAAGNTKEYTKIIPDGLLVPGAHVQYFFRKSNLSTPSVFHMGPDTNLVFPQASEANFDGHRWQQFGVLPDRWKDGAWASQYQNAGAAACILYIDWADRRLNELIWVSIADSIGATAPPRYGAHNGWHARGDQDITVEVGTDPSIAVYAHGGQPGTVWDMYGVKASESSTTASGLAEGFHGAGYQLGDDDARGPTAHMLRYYRILLILTADLAFGNLGPYEDKTSDDLTMISNFITETVVSDPDATPQPRGVWAIGQSFMDNLGSAEPHYSWGITTFGGEIGFVTGPYSQGNYRFESGNATDNVELFPDFGGTNRFSVFNDCLQANDWMLSDGAQTVGYYPNSDGSQGTDYASSIYAPDDAGVHDGVTLLEGFDIALMGSYPDQSSLGRLPYFVNAITTFFSGMCPALSLGSVSVGGENPNLVNFLALRSENPHRGGNAQLNFGITRKEKVELKVYDVTGRLVKVLANREFAAGEHTIFWDGSNEDGRLVPRGVYFYQLRTPTFVSQKKLAVLRH